jgi:hypothetical protein
LGRDFIVPSREDVVVTGSAIANVNYFQTVLVK